MEQFSIRVKSTLFSSLSCSHTCSQFSEIAVGYLRDILSKLPRHVAMVTTRIDQGNGRRAARAVYYQLLLATIVAAYLVTSGNCLPKSNAKQSYLPKSNAKQSQSGRPAHLKLSDAVHW